MTMMSLFTKLHRHNIDIEHAYSGKNPVPKMIAPPHNVLNRVEARRGVRLLLPSGLLRRRHRELESACAKQQETIAR